MASFAPPRFTVQDFLASVFDAGEATCFSPDIKGTRISAAHTPPVGSLFFSINPLHATKDTLRSAQKTTERPKRFRQSGHHQK